MRVSGRDAMGGTFEDSTEAVEVSRRGLSFLTERDIPMLATVTIVLPGLGGMRPGEGVTDFLSIACVVRVVKEENVNRVGVRFVGATLPVYTAE
jgi:hypothetical protein